MSGAPGSWVRMAAVDRAWLRMDDPTNLMIINGVLLFEDRLEVERVRQVLENRLLPIERFRQRVREARGRCYWETAPDFDLAEHLLVEELPGAAGEEELQEVVGEKMAEPLPHDRPLWRAYLFENYRHGSAMLWRLHHCIGDGIVLTLVLLSMTDLTPPPEAEELATGNPLLRLFQKGRTAAEEARQHLEQVVPEAVRLLTKPAEALASTRRWVKGLVAVPTFGRMSLRPPDPKTVFKGPLTVAKRVAWSEPVPMATIRELRQSIGGTVNDVLLNAVAGGLRRYLDDKGHSTSGVKLRGVIPVSLRPLERMADLGNQFGLVFLSLPVGIENPVHRLAEVRRRMGSLKRSLEPLVVLKVLSALGVSPRLIQDIVVRIFGTKATAVMTNVPGPQQTLYFAGSAIERLVFWVPQSGRLGMGISIFSYDGAATLGVVTDAGLVPDPERIVEGFEAELEVMQQIAAATG